MEPFVWESRIRFVDTDASGRIHYTALLRHFEAAEFEFLRAIGCPYLSFTPEEGGFPRAHVECDYLAALHCEDVISIAVTVERVGRTSYTLSFSAAKDGRVAGKGKIVVVCMDRETQRPKALPARLSEALEAWSKPLN
jgi:YbgC/YbaW family acyl-CoA thioester hydrolase